LNALTFILIVLAIAAWVSAVLLVVNAARRPYIGALVERAVISVLIAAFGTLCVGLVWNTDSGMAFIPLEVARLAFRWTLLGLLLVPVIWLLLLATDHLGGSR
jgi:hypothetical protein